MMASGVAGMVMMHLHIPAKEEPKDEVVTDESKLETKVETVAETKDQPTKAKALKPD